MYHLCGSLEGATGQVLVDLATDAKTADVIKLPQTRFGTELQAEWFKAELLVRRRRPDKTSTRKSAGWSLLRIRPRRLNSLIISVRKRSYER